LNVRPVLWIPVVVCFVLGIVSLIPLDTAESGTFLPYKSIIPLAPLSSILIWVVGGGFFYFLGRWATDRPIRSPYR
jgi:hypothetical protein